MAEMSPRCRVDAGSRILEALQPVPAISQAADGVAFFALSRDTAIRTAALGARIHMPSSLKSAGVYLRKEDYYIHPLAGSGGGDPCLLIGPVVKLTGGIDPATLGDAVRQALAASHHHAPWPTDWKHVSDPLFSSAGAKSLSTFMKGSRYVRVDLAGRDVVVLPTTTKEYRNAFSPLPGKEVTLILDGSHKLGLAVAQALAVSD